MDMHNSAKVTHIPEGNVFPKQGLPVKYGGTCLN